MIQLETEVERRGASSSRTTVGVGDMDMDATIDRWLTDIQLESSDEDLNMDIDNYLDIPLLPIVTSRTATNQPADDSGLSRVDAEMLRLEDKANDRQIRDLVPSNDYYDFNWSNSRHIFTGTKESFTGTPGPTFPVTNDLKPADIFYRMFDSDFIDVIVQETNKYADQILTRLQQNPTAARHSRLLRWTPTDRDEMMTFLAVIILQGLYPKVKETAYFSFDGFGTTPYFGRIISYNRYYLLKMFHHFIDNETTTDFTKLNKIRPVIDHFNNKFTGLYLPRQEIAISESLLKRHRRLSFAQKIRSKAAHVGVKTYELCESASGYLWKFLVYTGKERQNRTKRQDSNTRPDTRQGSEDRQVDDRPNRPERESDEGDTTDIEFVTTDSNEVRPANGTANIVYELMEPLLHLGHTLTMDNFYNSPLLARYLKRHGKTDVFGTLRLNREFVPDSIKTLAKTNMRHGEMVVTYCSDLAVMLWRDSNLISMISTYHPLPSGIRTKCNRLTYKPAIVLDYNKSMGGVGRRDQYLASQPLERQNTKIWYKKVFRRLYNAAIFNCFVIFTSNNQNNKICHRQFRTVLAEDLLKIHRRVDLMIEPKLFNRRLANSKTTNPTTMSILTSEQRRRPFVEKNHFPMLTGSKSTRCWLCSRNKKPARTIYKCEACNVNLCVIGCFKNYHKPAQ